MKLDANENSVINLDYIRVDNLNRYPEQDELIKKLAEYLDVNEDNLILGCGSDQLIDLIIATYMREGDKVLVPEPSFVMYEFYVKNRNGKIMNVTLKDGEYNKKDYLKAINESNPEVIFICNPNNPTGSTIESSDIEDILKATDSPVVVDEAYYEFYGESMIEHIKNYKNLIILRTFSKAFGLAGLRLGYMVAHEDEVKKLKEKLPPYNIAELSLQIGALAIENSYKMRDSVEIIKNNRKKLYENLGHLDIEVYKSYANFIFFKTKNDKKVYEELMKREIIIRYFPYGLRVTVGSEKENMEFLNELYDILSNIE